MDARAFMALLRWLGPWAPADAAPPGIARREARQASTRILIWSRAGAARPQSAMLLVPGLHYHGLDDPRFDRFARILAYTGATVVAPDVAAFRRLELAASALDDAFAAAELATQSLGVPPDRLGVFSISFGSILALHLAAALPLRGAVLFGGYHRFEEALRFALGDGGGTRPHDPLNGPAILLNLAPELLPPADVAPFSAAALEFCRRTWGKHDLKRHRRHVHAAWSVLADHTLAPAARALFLAATGLVPGALERAQCALAAAGQRHAWLDPTPLIPRVKSPVTLLHGKDDDVIPWEQSVTLAAALPNARAHITGLYGHTGHAGLGLFTAAAGVARELRTLIAMLSDLTRLSHE